MNCENMWSGKKWYCYGTSMTSVEQGNFSHPLAKMLGLEEHNFGKPGSGIVGSLSGDNVKSRTMRLSDGKAEADLITLETIPNDTYAPLGEITDTGDDTFCGNLNQILEYLLKNTRARVVVLIATRGMYNHKDKSDTYAPNSETAMKRLLWEETVERLCKAQGVPCINGAAECGLGYYRCEGNTEFVKDQIHLTERGGEILAKYFAARLMTIPPLD